MLPVWSLMGNENWCMSGYHAVSALADAVAKGADISVGDIAYRIGYGAPSSLSKAFRQFYSISPNEYRNNKEYTIMRPIE